MRRRITQAMVGVTAFVLLILGFPLAIVVQRWTLDSELVELQEAAAQTLAKIATPLDSTQLQRLTVTGVIRDPHGTSVFGVYLTSGERWFGTGPQHGDELVQRALEGLSASSSDDVLVVTTPINDQAEMIVGALRVERSRDGANQRARVAWLVMAGASATALMASWLLARRVAGHLSRPVLDLAVAATALGGGAILPEPTPTDIGEIDLVGSALAESSRRINDALVRERRFSADVSHQLRTPLASVQLRLEAARTNPSPSALDAALNDLGRLEETVLHLMAHARDAIPATATARLDLAAQRAAQRWTERVAATSRTLTVSISEPATTLGADASIDQILDALIDNALRHGTGRIHLTQRRLSGGAAIDVADEGALASLEETERIFQRGHGVGTGIGLALARSIAEAGDARLTVTSTRPTTFSLICRTQE